MNPNTNLNDFKVVSFHNTTDFGFTPEMGCMYDGRAINGPTGAPGINAGESMTLPYHIGHRLATNLAKMVMIRKSPTTPQKDADGNPMVAAIWDDVKMGELKNSFLKELYIEERPVKMSETDALFAKMEQLQKMVEGMQNQQVAAPVPSEPVAPVIDTETGVEVTTIKAPVVYQDKAEVIAALEARGIVHDKRKNKAELEKLIV